MPELLLPLPSQHAETTSACLVMVDLVGSTRLAHTLPLAHYMALMTEFVQVMILSFEARGGQVLQHQGDAVLGYWPESETDQACAAALESHPRSARIGLAGMLGVQLPVRVGVAAGAVITGVVGGQLSAYGLPVNYAKRLCDAAQPHETLACARVHALVTSGESQAQRPSLLEARPPLELHGFGPQCSVFRLRTPEMPGQLGTSRLPWDATPPAAHMKVD